MILYQKFYPSLEDLCRLRSMNSEQYNATDMHLALNVFEEIWVRSQG